MLITERKMLFFSKKEIYFIEQPFDISDCDIAIFYTYQDLGNVRGLSKITNTTTKIDLTQDIDQIWKKIKRQHKRHILRSKKNEITVTISNNYNEFYNFYEKFVKEKDYGGPFNCFIPSQKFMQKFGIIFIAKHQEKIIAGNLYLKDESNVLLFINASLNLGNDIESKKMKAAANCVLQWEAIQYFKNLGIKNYDMDGLWSDEKIREIPQLQGSNYFKLRFGGDVITRYFYKKINSRTYKTLFFLYNIFTNRDEFLFID